MNAPYIYMITLGWMINPDEQAFRVAPTASPPNVPPPVLHVPRLLYDAAEITWDSTHIPVDDTIWLGPRDVGDVLADIDDLLEEWELGDAMCWTPEEP